MGQVDNGGAATSTRRSKRKVEDRYDVFDHLAALHRKRRSQMERWVGSLSLSLVMTSLSISHHDLSLSLIMISLCCHDLSLIMTYLLLCLSSDLQEVPGSPQIDFLPTDSPSFHSTWQPPYKPAGLGRQVETQARRALFASELSGHGPVGFRKEDELGSNIQLVWMGWLPKPGELY